MELPQIEYADHHTHILMQKRRHVPMVPTIQKHVNVPQAEIIDKVVEAQVPEHVHVSMIHRVQKHAGVPQAETLKRTQRCRRQGRRRCGG